MTNFDPNRITYVGETDFRNKRTKFGIKAKDRTRHVYVIGKTGTGKSTFLENMAVQDIQNGEGFAFVDPHGKSANLLLDYIPENRINDVLYFAPFDLANPVSFNVMEDIGPDKRHLVAAGLMSAFKKIWIDAWSARMEYILNNTILALLEFPESTLLGINRMLVDKDYRKTVVASVTDPGVKSFWEDEFANYTDRFTAEATPAIQNKVGQFTANPVIRNIIGQPKSTFNIREIMDNRKILIINLSKGQIGEDSANLLGSMLITKIYLASMSRADLLEEDLNKLPNFYLYVDEFQSFANESFANILSEARKYKLNLTMAHQYIEQMSEEVRAAVFGNVGTMITFRVGATDAEYLEKEYTPAFTAEDLVNLGKYQIYLKLMIDDMASAPFSARTLPPIELPRISYRDVAIARSRAQFAQPRDTVEGAILAWHQFDDKKHSSGTETKDKGASPRREDTGRSKKEWKPKTPEERETELRKAMSLDRLKAEQQKTQKKAKGPTPEHVADLRSALAAALGTQDPVKESPGKSNQVSQSAQTTPEAQPQPQANTIPAAPPQQREEKTAPHQSSPNEDSSRTTPHEVPEHVLKKLFELEQSNNSTENS